MKTRVRNTAAAMLLGTSTLALSVIPAAAGGYIQTLGLGQRTSSLAGAVTAKSQDFDAFYTNPAGAADFNTPLIGLTTKIIDTTNLDVGDGGGGSIVDTFQGEAVAVAPAAGAYLPLIPGSVVAGLGIGAPFALAADFKDQPFGSIVSNEDTTDIELLYIEASPTLAVKLSDRINIGASVNFGVAKHLKESARFDNLAGLGNLVPDGQGISGVLMVQSDDDLPLPVAPWEFSTDPTAVTFTLGAQAQITDTLRFGVTYREETPNQFEGDIRLFTQLGPDLSSVLGLPGPVSVCTGPPQQAGVCDLNFGIERFRTDMELPRHIQFGFAWRALPNWELSFDAQWTNWSDATGFGSPLIVQLASTQSVNPATNGLPPFNIPPGASSQVGVGGITNTLCFLATSVGQPCPQGINQIFLNYNAQDAWSFMVGSEYKLNETWTILTGYQYDEAFMPNSSIDLITYDTDKHYITGGVEMTVPSGMGEWRFNLGGQLVLYEDNTVQPNQSSVLGGLGPNASLGGPLHGAAGQPNPGNNAITPPNAIGFGINEEKLDMGGYLWTVGASATLRFGATEVAAAK